MQCVVPGESGHTVYYQFDKKAFSPILTPANVLGLGWACMPAGLKAMEELAKLEAENCKQ